MSDVAERCPICNSDKRRDEPEYGKGAHSFSCGTVFRSNGDVAFRWGACVERAEKWLRRQLAQAQAEVERLRREREVLEEGVDGVTHFALYHPDLNVWECQAKDCGLLWEFEDGNPYEDGMRFCPRCGRRIVREAQQKRS